MKHLFAFILLFTLVACTSATPTTDLSAANPAEAAALGPIPETILSQAQQAQFGRNFQDFTTIQGDAACTAPDESVPPNDSDVTTLNAKTQSELLVNTTPRNILAHNITFKRVIDAKALGSKHVYAFQFRLPEIPDVNNPASYGETFEAAFNIWDGANTRLDYIVAFQLKLNPWDCAGTVNAWSANADAGQWEKVGTFKLDTAWHTVLLSLNPVKQTASILIDDQSFTAFYARTTRPADWGNTVDIRFQVEAISLWPCKPGGVGYTHNVFVRNWAWLTLPANALDHK